MEPAKAQAGLDLHPSEGATLLFEPPSSPPTPSHHLAVMLHPGRQRMAELVPFLEKKKKKKVLKHTVTTHQNYTRDCFGPPTNRAANTPGQKPSPARPEAWEPESASLAPGIEAVGPGRSCSRLWHATASLC